MGANAPRTVVIEGIELVIKRDLVKHKGILDLTKRELLAYREARSHEIKKKQHYSELIGGGKYNDDALRESMLTIASNIRHLSDKATAAEQKVRFETKIVDTLTTKLEEQNEALKVLAEYRGEHGPTN